MEDQTRLSRFLGSDPLYKFLDDLYHYPAFLFHDSPGQRALRAEFGDDYRHSLDLLLRSGFGTRNLGARLRAFRMQHDLTLIETAALLDLSKSELHRLERAERRPSPRTRYRILRLLTLPLEGHGFSERSRSAAKVLSLPKGGDPALFAGSPAKKSVSPSPGGKPAGPVLSEAEGSLRSRQAGRAGNQRLGWVHLERSRRVAAGIQPAARRASSEGSQGNPRRVSPPPAGSHPPGLPASSPARRPSPSRAGTRVAWLAAARAAPPPRSDAPSSAETLSGVEGLRQLWLAGSLKTKDLAASLGVSPPHLIRLLRGDRRPSKKLTERLESLLATARQVPGTPFLPTR